MFPEDSGLQPLGRRESCLGKKEFFRRMLFYKKRTLGQGRVMIHYTFGPSPGFIKRGGIL